MLLTTVATPIGSSPESVPVQLRDYVVSVRDVPAEWLSNAEPIWWCESGADPAAERWTTVRGVRYHVIGLMQLLFDSAIASLAADMGFSEDDLFDPEINLQVAYAWDSRTGGNFRMWSCHLKG